MSLSDQIKSHPPAQWKPRPDVLCRLPIPLPMHGLAPRIVLGDEWWDAVRFTAYRSTDYHCIACCIRRGSTDWCKHIEGHEIYDVDHLCGRMTYVETVPLCYRCHKFTHTGYLRIQFEQGVIDYTEYRTVLDYGSAVLNKHKLRVAPPYVGPSVEWHEWLLVIGDKEYPPLCSSFEQYKERFGNA